MTLTEALELVRPIRIVEPGPTALAVLDQSGHQRYASLSNLQVVNGRCVWCNVESIVKPRRRWCSDECAVSGSLYCHPQNPAAKAWILIQEQSCACRFCGLDYSEKVIARIQDRYSWNKRNRDQYPGLFKKDPDPRISYFQIGNSTGETWEVDHIVPIHKGGRGIGFDNIQVICVACHRKKTVEDRRPVEFTPEIR